MMNLLKSLFNKNKPYKIAKTLEYGFLNVGNGHKIYYEISGNKNGTPVVNLHGGPGGSLSLNKRKWFNPKKYYIIQFDQRGCGKSEPVMCLDHNTTQHLIDDMEALRKHLNIDRWVVTGGSWGSTLALAYAAKFKSNILALMINSVFLATVEELEAAYSNKGPASYIFADEYAKFLSPLTNTQAKKPLKSYLELIETAQGLEKEFLLRTFLRWECLLLGLNPDIANLDKFVNSEEFDTNLAAMELFYMANNFYLDDKELVSQLDSLSDIPTYIAHGRYDLLCSAKFAQLVHDKIAKSKLVFTFDGHSIKSKQGLEQIVGFTNQILKDLEDK